MTKKEHKCSECPNSKKHDESPNSFTGRLWRWYINFCPGWRKYMSELSEQERLEIRGQYSLKK